VILTRIRPAVQRLRGEDGMTLTELMVTVSFMTLVSAVFISVVLSLQTHVIRQQERSMNNDAARTAIARLDREIRSGNVLYDPGDESPPGQTMRIYTQANADTRDPSFQCVQWTIQDGKLLRRFWPQGQPDQVSSWRVETEHIVNVEEGVQAFSLDADPDKGGRTVNVVIMVESNPNRPGTSPVRIQTALTGRNTSFGFPVNVCDPVPAA
jgi:hypothetical protein